MKQPLEKRNRGTRVVRLGTVMIGGGNPVVVQSMTNTDTKDAAATSLQIKKLARAGCEVIRVSVPDQESAAALPKVLKSSPIPVVADIHFDPALAQKALEAGINGLRLNPGNIRNPKALQELIREASARRVPIRVGVNAGSVARDLREKHGGSTAAALVESALEHLKLLEDAGYDQVKVSLKASDIATTVEAYRRMRQERDYPLHLGITEAGTAWSGLIKSAAGLGIMLYDGIGDTIRVSLAADPVEEVRAGFAILRSLGLRDRGIEVIACPTCARTRLNVIKTARAVETRLAHLRSPLKIAVMGCGVNGPGEARHADLGVVGTPKGIQLYVAGERAGTVEDTAMLQWILDQAARLAREKFGEEPG